MDIRNGEVVTTTIVQMLAKAESLGIDTTGMTDERGDVGFTFYMIAGAVLEESHNTGHPGALCQDCAEIGHSERLLTEIVGLDESPEEWDEILRESQEWWPDFEFPPTEQTEEQEALVAETCYCIEMNHVCRTAHLLAEVLFQRETCEGS
jgi:hypothetical protein